ncbi:MAG: HlyD family efflux transporter periplasmic adaptor subunit [Cyanophyceae cyanobacterium]
MTNQLSKNGRDRNGHHKQRGAKTQVANQSANDSAPKAPSRPFDQGVVLKQSPKWSRAVVYTIMGVATFGVAWASFAKIEQAVPAQGQLKPQETVKEVQAPVNGVVKEVFVEEGERVEEGALLATLDPTASKAELESLKSVRNSLEQENQFYQVLMEQSLDPFEIEEALVKLEVPPQIVALARNRATLVAENQLYRAQVGSIPGSNLSPEQRARLRAATAEMNSRASAARLEVAQLQRQLNQNRAELADARAQLLTAQQVLSQIGQRNEQSVDQAERSLEIERQILSDISPLIEEGAIAKIQLDRQRQEVSDRYAALVEQQSNGRIEYDQQQQQVQTIRAQIDQLAEESQRLQLDIAQAKEELVNTSSGSERDVLDRIAENTKRIAEIDSQLTKLMLDNQNRLAELDSQISRTNLTLQYQELRAPVSGTVFDLQATPGFVPNPSQAEALLKIVPEDHLVAEVYVTNQDIGFVREGQNADVRIDSFPFSEFGDIDGTITSVGSDALPPDEIDRFYRFPVKVNLEQQVLETRGEREIPLQSGMSVSVNIKVREKRTVLSLFTELFSDKVESLKQVR